MATNNATNTSNPINVSQGGTGDASLTAYAVLCGGTISTGNIQSIAGLGSSTQVLTSNGPNALPTFQDNTGGGMILISSQSATNATDITFTSIGSYKTYFMIFRDVVPQNNATNLYMQISNNNGSTWIATNYLSSCIYFALNTASPTPTGSGVTTAFTLASSMRNGGGNQNANGSFYIYDVNVARECNISGTCDFDNSIETRCVGALLLGQAGANGANAFQITFSSGNIVSGIFTLYGVITS